MSGTTSPAVTWTRPIAGYRTAETRMGDTIQAIALREMGDAGQWTVLVSLNGLVAPYLTDDFATAGPGILLAGQQNIQVPAPAPAASGVADAAEVFGTDAMLTKGRLTFTSSGDIQTVTGVPNLVQAIQDRFATHLRDLLRHPTYGLDLWKLIGRGGTSANLRLAAVYVQRALNSDPRISSVKSCVAVLVGDAISVTAVAVPVTGTPVPLIITIPTRIGGNLLSVAVQGTTTIPTTGQFGSEFDNEFDGGMS